MEIRDVIGEQRRAILILSRRVASCESLLRLILSVMEDADEVVEKWQQLDLFEDPAAHDSGSLEKLSL